ncbi:UvrD-helicase domain-containing protein [Mixta tenebrionis]|uniref:DNA 3'-5' helicase n=2 Tax=Mixta TaxID=2100764 RepID=A0A6P1Q202_9GAMM|nr:MULTISPECIES: UvrD-helicase domain-containing protein [Mixta]QHM72613.1 ATP-dependent helicase/nuclease subunit A [Mixta intestinalis]TPW38356.1 ATP-dependent helicase [Mixta tenebrionis]
MSWSTTREQDAIIHWKGSRLVVNAFAGTGKTSTLVRFALTNPDSRMLYLAYNRAIRDEAEQKFPFNVECKTSHQLAWSRFGRHFRHRLVANLRITDAAKMLNTRHWPLVRQAIAALNAFLCSAESEPGVMHLLSEDDRNGLSGLSADKILGATQILWHQMSSTDSTFPVTHDVYLKLFQLSNPDLARRWDTILFDEAQDANPVTSAFVLSQPCRVILVGDRYQQIYRFRGADNALSAPLLESADRLWLTNSFRFGPEVARMANILLTRAGETMQVTGSGGEDQVTERLPADVPHFTVLSRTVAGVIGAALVASLHNKKVFWVGGIAGYKTEELEDLYWFSVDMPERMQSPNRLTRDYRDFEEYCSIAKATRDAEMNQAIRLLDEFFPLPEKLAIMRGQAVTDKAAAQVTVSTAHRSKGLEWDVVVLNEDFSDITDPLLSTEERQDETNLLYVATTRARRVLVLNELMTVLRDNEAREDEAATEGAGESGQKKISHEV